MASDGNGRFWNWGLGKVDCETCKGAGGWERNAAPFYVDCIECAGLGWVKDPDHEWEESKTVEIPRETMSQVVGGAR